MDDRAVEFRHGEFTVSTDRGRLDLAAAHDLLRTTPWAADMGRDVLARAVANSVCFGLYHGDRLVGFGRAVTDLATYAYWTDVVVDEAYRGRGLGLWLAECMLDHPGLQGFRRVALLTRDAAPLYARLGFAAGPGSLTYMERRPP